MLFFLLIRGAMLRKMILMLANVPECAAIYPVAVEMEQHIVCQMRVRPGRHISLYSAMQMRNPPDWKQTLTISDSGLPGATISLGFICFYGRLDPRLLSCWRTVGQEEEPPPPPPVVFEDRVVASMQRHLAFLEQMWGGENGMQTMTTVALFLLTVLSDSLIMMLMLEPWKLSNHHPLRSVVCCAFPSSCLSQTVAKIFLDNRMAWDICAQMWAFIWEAIAWVIQVIICLIEYSFRTPFNVAPCSKNLSMFQIHSFRMKAICIVS